MTHIPLRVGDWAGKEGTEGTESQVTSTQADANRGGKPHKPAILYKYYM